MLAGLFASGCFETHEIPIAPGTTRIDTTAWWIQGTPTKVYFEWHNDGECNSDDWSCTEHDGLTFTVMSIACHGCALVGKDPTGTAFPSKLRGSMLAVATTDGSVSLELGLRFDATGARRTVTTGAFGDHEVAVEAKCDVIPAAAFDPQRLTDPSLLRPCGATRAATDVVLVFPAVRTFHEQLYYPFCLPGTDCFDADKQPLRPVMLTPEPASWGRTLRPADQLDVYGAYPSPTTSTIELKTTLRAGGDASVTVAVPAIAAPPGP